MQLVASVLSDKQAIGRIDAEALQLKSARGKQHAADPTFTAEKRCIN
jgi:hypothetical protein